MAREVSNESILQGIYDWTGSTNGTMESLEEMRGAIRSLCLCSEDVERSEDVEGPHPWSDEGEDEDEDTDEICPKCGEKGVPFGAYCHMVE
jgi:hypothetical protein